MIYEDIGDERFDLSDERKIDQMYKESGCDLCPHCLRYHPGECKPTMNHNHPVFPQHPNSEIDSGLTKREYIAICAMQALIQTTDSSLLVDFMDEENFSRTTLKGLHPELIAKASCAYADALLKELENPND